MRVHFSSIVTVFVALSLVSGTVGCRSNGGPWYNPATYSFSNPFGKEGPSSPYSSGVANRKPSLDSQPNVSAPHGGYTDSTSFVASPASSDGIVSSTPPAHWSQQTPAMQQNSPNPHGGYTVADPSQYSPQTYTQSYAESYGGQGSFVPTSTHQYPVAQGQPSLYPSQPESIQQANSYPAMPYGDQYAQTAYQTTSAYQQQPIQPMHNVPAEAFGTIGQPGQQPGPYGSYGAMPPSDPYTAMQQPTAVPQPQPGFGQEQMMPSSFVYPGEGGSATPYQPYQPPAASGAQSY